MERTVEELERQFAEDFAPTSDLPELQEEFRNALDDLFTAALRAARLEALEEAARFHKRNHLEDCRCKRCREANAIRALGKGDGA